MNDEVGDEMLGRWELEEEVGVFGEGDGLGVSDDFGGGEDARGEALADGAVEFDAHVALAEHGRGVMSKVGYRISAGGLG